MAEITVALIKELRDKTSAGMMDCKAALQESGGDLAEAETILRKKGISDAEKRSGRSAKEGVVASRISDDGKTGILVEVNCETDFVAKNENFQNFVEAIIDHISESGGADSLEALLAQPCTNDESGSLDEFIKSKVGQLGENMGLARFARYDINGNGVAASYIHMNGRVGVLIEIATGNADTAGKDAFGDLAKDLGMHIAAAQPLCLDRDGVPAEKAEAEKDIFREQMKGKPADIIDRILDGKMNKFYSTNCLLEQGFVKDTDKSVADLLAEVGKEVGDEISIVRFERYGLGETQD